MPFSDRIMTTKLRTPRVGVKLLERPRLWEILKRYQSKKLILVSGPAGYGKTVLISQFTAQISSSTTWYHLDCFDNDFNLFIQHLLAGLDYYLPGVAEDMLYLTKHNKDPAREARRITTALVNILSDRLEEELILVIDDYHVVDENAVHEFMEQLLYYLPENMHIILASRTRPPMNLERLRLAGLVEEIGLEELRFNRDEIAGFLMAENSEQVSSETVTFLEEKTGGWPAALRLAGIAMFNSGNNVKAEAKEVLPRRKEIYQYLAAEVLSHMPSELSDFVLFTSVLDIMTPEICDLFLERTDSKQVLEDLEVRNLFITAMEEEYQLYRYHPLFKDFLQSRLKEEQKGTLFEKAGHAYLQAGYLSQAIESFLQGGDYVQALSTIEKAGSKMLLHNRWQTVQRWLESIPANLKRAQPRVLLLEGSISLNRGRLNQAETLINEAASALSDSSDREGECQAKLCQARILRSRGKYKKSIELLEQILPDLSQLPVSEWYDVTLEHSLTLIMQGEFAKACNLLEPALGRAENEGQTYISAWLAERLSMLYYFKGDYSRAVEVHQQAAEMAPEQDRLSFSLQDSMATIYHDWGDLDLALDYAQSSIKIKERLVLIEALPYTYSQLALILDSMGEPAAAEDNFRHSINLSRNMGGDKFFLALSLAFYSKFLADQGRLKEARSTGKEALEISSEQSAFINAVCKEMAAYAYLKEGRLQEASSMLQQALETLEKVGAKYFIFYAKAFLAAVYLQQSNHPEAEQLAESALGLAGPENYLQFFLSHRELMYPVVRTVMIKGKEPDFIQEILSKWGNEAEALLLELSRHEDPQVRERVVVPLAQLQGRESTRALEKLLGDTHENVRDRALVALATSQKDAISEVPEKSKHEDKAESFPSPGKEASLKVECLGRFRVIIGGKEATWRTTKARDLFAYLFHCREKPVLKDKILEDLWPDSSPERASTLFHTNLYHLRRAVKKPGIQPVKHREKHYYLDQSMLSSDIGLFEELVMSLEKSIETEAEEITELERAVSLYQGEYMEDLDYPWVTVERERLNKMYLFLLDRLAHRYMESEELDSAATCLRTILRYNPLLEDTHALLMNIYARMGDRMAVMQQYQTLSRVLQQEMGLDPSPKTRELYYKLCSEEEQ